MSSQIKTLFIDVGGVILTNGWDRHSRELAAEKFHLDLKEMNDRHNLTFDTYEIGKITLQEYLDRVVFFERREFSHRQFLDFMFAQSLPYVEMIELISQLKRKYSLKVVVVSNEGRELADYRIKTFNLSAFVDFFISSCFVHFRKPDKDIYRIALEVSQASPNEILYIEDRGLFIDIAKELGICGIHHQDYTSTCHQLASFGLK